MRRLVLIPIAATLILGVAACGHKAASPPVPKVPVVTCPFEQPMPQSAPAKVSSRPPAIKIVSSHSYTACVETTAGNFVIKLMRPAAKQAVNAFVILSNHHFYDGSPFNEVAKDDFIAATKPSPGFALTNHNQGTYFLPTTVFVGHNTAGKSDMGQIFICTGAKCESLDGTASPRRTGYTVIGVVSKGMQTVRTMERRAVKGSVSLTEGRARIARTPVRIKTIRIYVGNQAPSFPADDSGS